MKNLLKQLVYRTFRPAFRDTLEQVDRLYVQGSRNAERSSQSLADLGRQTAQLAAAAELTAQRLARIERRLVTAAAWRGGMDGKAVDFAGNEVPEMTTKYRDELGYWEAVVRRDAVKTWNMPFEEIYGAWQRVRMTELAEFLGIAPGQGNDSHVPGNPGLVAITEWAKTRSSLEIGSGPYPSIALAEWSHATALDPLADGYVQENLVPTSVHADKVVFMAAAGESIPLASARLDLVVLENSLDHVEDPVQVVRECHRLLKPGGLLWLLVDLMDYKDHLHPSPFSEASIKGLLSREGFTPVRERVNDHKSHPAAYGEYRGLLRKA
jgi:SAM-dependent methyltransferase